MGSVEHRADHARDDEAETASYGELETEQVRQDLTAIAVRQGTRPRPGRRQEGGSRAASGGLADGHPRYNANNVSHIQENPSSEAESAVRQDRRERRFAQRQALWAITSLDRVRKCGRTTNGNVGDGLAAIVVNGSVAHWSGFCTCGSIWACPVCSAKIRATRADEIARAVAAHMTRDGGTAWMVTLTARHKRHHDLAPLFDAVANGWRKLMSGRAWAGDPKRGVLGERDRLGVRGNIRSMEVTYGTRNGWHPHLHVVLLLDNETGEELAYAIHRWDKTWRAWMKKQGFEPSKEHGVKWSKVTTPEEAGEYIAKTQEGKHIGNEIARGDFKKGKFSTLAPFELLEYFRQTGDMAVLPVWQEYEQGTHRRRAITWSRGLRAELLGDEPELSDEEVAAEEVGGETWAILPAESLRAIRRVPGLQTRLLDAAENGGFIELVNLLTAYHLTYQTGPDAPKTEASPAAS